MRHSIDRLTRSQELESIILEKARKLGEAEPELFHDENIDISGPDNEKLLNQIIEYQEHMAKIMKLIEQVSNVLACAKAGAYIPKSEWSMWINRRKLLWENWFKFQKRCMTIADQNKSLWHAYFALCEEELTPYFTNFDPEEIDGMEKFTARYDIDDMAEAHIAENKEFLAWMSLPQKKMKSKPHNENEYMTQLLKHIDQLVA